MLADLHVHTYFSDSTRSPEEVASVAKAQGIGVVAICDHNTVAAHARAAAACTALGIEWIPGVEIDAAFAAGDQHILAFGCDFANPALLALLEENARVMEQVSIDLIQRMRADDPRLDPEAYATYRRQPQRGGWKGVDYLRTKGYAIDYPDCMKFYARYACRPSAFPSVEQVASVVHAAGGLAILAHPGDRLQGDALQKNLELLVSMGIDGVECHYPSHSEAFKRACLDFCEAKRLCVTAGSDDHGGFAEWVDGIHYALGEVRVDTEALRLDGRLP